MTRESATFATAILWMCNHKEGQRCKKLTSSRLKAFALGQHEWFIQLCSGKKAVPNTNTYDVIMSNLVYSYSCISCVYGDDNVSFISNLGNSLNIHHQKHQETVLWFPQLRPIITRRTSKSCSEREQKHELKAYSVLFRPSLHLEDHRCTRSSPLLVMLPPSPCPRCSILWLIVDCKCKE